MYYRLPYPHDPILLALTICACLIILPLSEAAKNYASRENKNTRTVSCSPYKGTGAYREVCSFVGNGFENGTVYLPSAAKGEVFIGAPGDVPYVYMGGFVPDAVDAGWQYSPTYDNWAPIINAKGVFTLCEDVSPQCSRVPGGTTVQMSFQINQDDQTVSLSWTCNSCNGQFTLTSKNTVKVDINNCLVKRITSIAQDKENFGTGSNITNVQWSGCMLGPSPADAQQWDGSSVSNYINYPDKTVIQVGFQDPSDETDAVILDEGTEKIIIS